MKKIFLAAAIVGLASAALALDPDTLTITNVRNEVEGYASSNEVFRGAPLLLTNCVAFAGTSNTSARQDLTDLSIVVKIGIPSTNVTYTGTAIVATNGTWACRIASFPTNWDQPSIQVTLTNSTEKFIYPLKTIKTRQSL